MIIKFSIRPLYLDTIIFFMPTDDKRTFTITNTYISLPFDDFVCFLGGLIMGTFLLSILNKADQAFYMIFCFEKYFALA